MQLPVQLRVALKPSPVMAVAVFALAVAALAIWLTFPTSWWIDALAAAGLAVWACDRIRVLGTRSAGRAAVELLLSEDGVIVVRRRDGRLVAGHVRSATFIHPVFTSIVWRPDGTRFSRSVPVIADMLDPDDFRRLRVLLRYGRREVDAGSPASQA